MNISTKLCANWPRISEQKIKRLQTTTTVTGQHTTMTDVNASDGNTSLGVR